VEKYFLEIYSQKDIHVTYVEANQLTVASVKVQCQYECAISLEIKYLADFRVKGKEAVHFTKSMP
jgi:hypothetical protein